MAAKTESKLDDAILRNVRAPIFLLAILFGLYYGLVGVASLQPYSQEFALAFTVGQILVVTFIITRIVNVLISWYAEESVKRFTAKTLRRKPVRFLFGGRLVGM